MALFREDVRDLTTFILLACLAWSLIIADIYHLFPTETLERAFIALVSPLSGLATRLWQNIGVAWQTIVRSRDLVIENRALRTELAKLKRENSELHRLEAENTRLRKLLRFAQTAAYEEIPAEVVGKDPTNWFRTIIINKGTASGIKENMVIVSHQGVVGRVTNVTRDYSVVTLITAQGSAIAARIERSGEFGVVKGQGGPICRIDYISRDSDIREGDIAISSGSEAGVFPKGLRIGRVTSVKHDPASLFKSVELSPSVEFARLEEVLVLKEE